MVLSRNTWRTLSTSEELLPQVDQFKCLGVLDKSVGRMEWETDAWTNAAATETGGKALQNWWIYILTLSCGSGDQKRKATDRRRRKGPWRRWWG